MSGNIFTRHNLATGNMSGNWRIKNMEILDNVLKEELNRLKKLKNHNDREISKLPKGSLIKKKISGNTYYYLNYRNGKKKVFKYVGKLKNEEVINLSKKIERRRKLWRQNIEIKKNIERLKKVIHEKKK